MAEEPSYLRYFGYEPEALRCPQQTMTAARESGGVEFVDAAGFFLVTGHGPVNEIMRDPESFSSHISIGPRAHEIYDQMLALARDSGELRDKVEDYAAGPRHVLINADPPEHRRHRQLINHAFTPARVREFEPRIEAIADRLIDGFDAGGRVELVSEFTEKYTMEVVRLILGVPAEDMPLLREWSEAFGRGVGTEDVSEDEIVELAKSRLSFDAYFTERIRERLREPGDDLVTDIATGRVKGEQPLSDDELLAVFQQLVLGGNATIGSLLNDCIVRLLEDPSSWAELRADPDLIEPFVEEVLRQRAPVQAMFRQASRDAVVAGVEIPAGSVVYLSLAAASRDPEVFEDPDEFRPGRANAKQHLALGVGPHFCVGAHLGRAEARIALSRLLARFDSVRVANGAEITFAPSIVFHTPVALELELEAVAKEG